MLVLSRKINQTIVIGGNIHVTLTAIRNHQVRLAIDAPPEIRIMREELVPIPAGDVLDRGEPAPPQPGRERREDIRRPRVARPAAERDTTGRSPAVRSPICLSSRTNTRRHP
jgi:carbon storage regulator